MSWWFFFFKESLALEWKPRLLAMFFKNIVQSVIVVQSLSHVQLFVTLLTAACQDSLSFISSQNLLKLMSTESMIPFNHLICCRPLLLLPSILPSIRAFSNELVLPVRWPKYWNFSFSLSTSMNIQDFF